MRMKLRIRYNEAAAILYFCAVPLVFLTGAILPSGIPRRLIIGIVVWILFLLGYARVRGTKFLDSFLVYIGVGLIFLFAYWNHPEYKDLYSERVFSHILSGITGVTGYFVVRQIYNRDSLFKVLKASAYILFFYYFFRSFDVIRNGYWTVFSVGTASNVYSNSSMEFGYSMLLPALLFAAFYCIEKKRIYLIFSVIGIIEILLYGGRGPVLAYLCFIVIYFIFIWTKDPEIKYRGLKIFGLIILLLTVYFLFDTVIGAVAQLLSSMGIKSRVLDYVVSGHALDDNGRNWIHLSAYALIANKSIFSGYGPLGDYYQIGYYSHNMAIELAVEFGVLIAAITMILLVISVVRSLIKCKDQEYAVFLIVFICAGLIKLMFSNYFWAETNFWIMLGMMVNVRMLNKERENYRVPEESIAR